MGNNATSFLPSSLFLLPPYSPPSSLSSFLPIPPCRTSPTLLFLSIPMKSSISQTTSGKVIKVAIFHFKDHPAWGHPGVLALAGRQLLLSLLWGCSHLQVCHISRSSFQRVLYWPGAGGISPPVPFLSFDFIIYLFIYWVLGVQLWLWLSKCLSNWAQPAPSLCFLKDIAEAGVLGHICNLSCSGGWRRKLSALRASLGYIAQG